MLQVAQYRGVLYLQYLLVFVDIFINAFVDVLPFSSVIQLVLFIIQDVCLIFAAIVVFLMFFNTYVFQAGLVGYLVTKFKFTVLILFLYFAMCVSLHIWTMISVGFMNVNPEAVTVCLCNVPATLILNLIVRLGIDCFYSLNTLRWDDTQRTYIWKAGFQALYILQRVGAVFYYYYYKRTALRLGDPRFYKDSDWLRQQFEKVR